jgi:hypothetical protein
MFKGVVRGKVGWVLRIAHESDGSPGPESASFSGRSILPVILTRPTKGWPCEVADPRPRARPSCLLVDPGISVPHTRSIEIFFLFKNFYR